MKKVSEFSFSSQNGMFSCPGRDGRVSQDGGWRGRGQSSRDGTVLGKDTKGAEKGKLK